LLILCIITTTIALYSDKWGNDNLYEKHREELLKAISERRLLTEINVHIPKGFQFCKKISLISFFLSLSCLAFYSYLIVF
jgi:hypothetical protein